MARLLFCAVCIKKVNIFKASIIYALKDNNKKFISSYLGLYTYDDANWGVYYTGTDSTEIEDTV